MKYWQNRYNSQGHKHYGATLHITDCKYDDDLKGRKEFLKSFMGDFKPRAVLDFGCGNANMCDMFDGFYVGVDILSDLIGMNSEKYKKSFGLIKEFDVFSYPPTKPIKFDLILCISSLQYIDDEKLIKWIASFKKGCNNLIIQDSTIKSDGHTYYRPHEDLKKLCVEQGFIVHKEISEGARWLWLK